MNAPLMNKVQLCCTGPARVEMVSSPRADAKQAGPRKAVIPQGAARRAAALMVVAVTVAIGAAAWLVMSRAAPPLAIVELPRVVITAQRLPPGICPVPVEPVGADCPVPLQTGDASVAADAFPLRSLTP